MYVDVKENVWTEKGTSREEMTCEIEGNAVEVYLEKIDHMVLGDTITTKLVRITADNLNPKEQIVLRKQDLLKCDFDDLLK